MATYWEEERVPTLAEMQERLAYLEREIAEYPYWGAALTAMDEEARGLRRNIALTTPGVSSQGKEDGDG